MARKTIAVGEYIEQFEQPKHYPSQSSYVGPDGEDSPLAGLLWREVRQLERRARLTPWQASVMELHLQGISDADIGRIFCGDDGEPRTRQSVRDCRLLAFQKISRLPHIGLLTVMVEELGWEQVRGHLANIFEKNFCQQPENSPF